MAQGASTIETSRQEDTKMNFDDYIEKAISEDKLFPDRDSAIQRLRAIDDTFLVHTKVHFEPNEKIHISIHNPTLYGLKPPYPHRHAFYELVYVHTGSFCHEIGTQSMIQGTDTAYLFNLNSVHNPWIQKKTDRVFNILLDKQFVEKIFINLFQEGSPFLQFFLDSLCGVRQRKNYLIFPVTGKIRQLFQDIICEYYDRNNFYEEIMTAKLLQLFSEISRNWMATSAASIRLGRSSHASSEILAYIEQHYASVTLSEVAEAFNYSPRQTGRLIKKETGKTFTELVLNYKIENACYYIQNTSLPFDQILHVTGFCTAAYFYRMFKKNQGITFSEFKRQLKK